MFVKRHLRSSVRFWKVGVVLGFSFALPLTGQSTASGVTVTGSVVTRPTPAVLIAPGQVITFGLTGVQSRLPPRGMVADAFPLPTSLQGFSAVLRQTRQDYSAVLPILSISQVNHCADEAATSLECLTTQLTVQIPYDIHGSPPGAGIPLDIGPTELTIIEGGRESRSFSLFPVPDRVHIANGCDAGPTSSFAAGRCIPAITRSDGTLVSYPVTVKPGEVLTVYATGLGVTVPPIKAGEAAPVPAPTVDRVLLRYDFVSNAKSFTVPLITAEDLQVPEFAGLVPGLAGLYQVNFNAPSPPSGTPACGGRVQSNLTVTVVDLAGGSTDSFSICVDVGAM